MTAKPHVIVATANDIELNRWIVAGRAAGIDAHIMSDSRETFASAQKELEALHSRVHKLNSELGFLTEKINMMCLRLVNTLGEQEAKTP